MSEKKRPVGAPLKYTPEQLQALIDAYFLACDSADPPEPYTVGGLCLACNTYRKLMDDYEDRPEFSYMIKTAKLKVAVGYEKNLHGSACTGSMFALKSIDQDHWRDRQEVTGANGAALIPTGFRITIVDPDVDGNGC